MRKFLILAVLAGTLLALSLPAAAAATVNFNVQWIVDPILYFKVGFDGNFVTAVDGDTKTLQLYDFGQIAPAQNNMYENREVLGSRIQAWVWSNDMWRLDFNKPALVSNNNDNTAVDVLFNRRIKDMADANFVGETGWLSGANDPIQSDMGAYAMEWDLKILYNYWHTRSGIYQNTFQFVVTQL